MSVKIKVLFVSSKLAKINSKWIIDLNIRAKSKASRRKHRRQSLRTWVLLKFLDGTQKAQNRKKKSNKLNFIKMKNFSSLSEN